MEWISVKDRMPTGYVVIEEGVAEPEEYIVHVKGAEYATTAMFDGERFVKSVFEDIGGFSDEINYWMPLPKPPQEVKDLILYKAGTVVVTPLDANMRPDYTRSVATEYTYLASTQTSVTRATETLESGNGSNKEIPNEEDFHW